MTMTADDLKRRLQVARDRRDAARARITATYVATCDAVDQEWFAERNEAIEEYCREHPGESKEGWTP